MNKKYAHEFIIVLIISLWLIFYNAVFTPAFLAAHRPGGDIYYYYTGNGPDGSPLPYPSLAFVYFDTIHAVSFDAASFSFIFQFLSLVWLGLIFFLYSKILGKSELVKIFFIFAPVFFLVPIRIEIVAVALSLLGVYSFISGKRLLGWSLVIIASFVKVFPVVFLPMFFILELKNFKKGISRVIPAALLSVVLFFSASASNLHAVSHNAERGIEMESTYAGLLSLANVIHPLGISVEYNFGSHNLALPPSLDFLPTLTLLLQAAALLAFLILFYLDKKKESRVWLYAFLLIAATIFFGKILSPQFILWPLAFATVLIKNEKLNLLYPLCILLAVLSLIVFPFLLDSLVEMDGTAVLILNLRNLIFGAILVYVARMV